MTSGLFCLFTDSETSDIFPDLKDELEWYKHMMMIYRDATDQPNDRVVCVVPAGSHHRLKETKPGRLTIEELDGFTTYHQREQGTWLYMHEGVDTPVCYEMAKRIAEKVGYTGDNIQMGLSFKGPGYKLPSHVDLDCGNNNWRYHVIIDSSEGNWICSNTSPPAEFWAVDEDPSLDYEVIPKEGEVWAMDVTVNHSAGNRSEEDSYHLIVDLL